jgi:hypothetical protein
MSSTRGEVRPMTTTDTDVPLCRCGHERHPHTHLRPGTNCSRCGCPEWRAAGWRSRATTTARLAAMGMAYTVAGIALLAVVLVAFAFAVHGLILVFRAIP